MQKFYVFKKSVKNIVFHNKRLILKNTISIDNFQPEERHFSKTFMAIVFVT